MPPRTGTEAPAATIVLSVTGRLGNTFYCPEVERAPRRCRRRPEGARCRHRPGPHARSTSWTEASTSTPIPATPASGPSPHCRGTRGTGLGGVQARGRHLRVHPCGPVLLGPRGPADPVDRLVDHRARRRPPHPAEAPPQPGLLPADDPGDGDQGPSGGHRGARRHRHRRLVRLRGGHRHPHPARRDRRAHGPAHRGPPPARRMVGPDDGRRGPDRPRRPDDPRRHRRVHRVRGLRGGHGGGPANGPPGRPRTPDDIIKILVGADEDGVLESSEELPRTS